MSFFIHCRKPSIKIRIVTLIFFCITKLPLNCRKPSIKIRIVTLYHKLTFQAYFSIAINNNVPKTNENKCPKCGSVVDNSFIFCDKCGYKLK